ncbi:MAG: DUF2029 domain-containing protein [Anaerolineales bacterium]|nr:DUF2029 domain-containing protein [Anaerolineales bacterium]
MHRASWPLLAAALALHLGLLVGWRWQLPLTPYFFDATVLSGGRGLDFYSIYQAGYNARHGWDIYEGDPTRVEIVVPYFTPYRYLPVVAYTLGAALSLLTPLTAYKAWVVVIELTLLGCAALTWRRTRADPNLAARLTAMWLVFTPYYLELFMGQFSLIQGALVLAMLLAVAGLPRAAAAPPLTRTRARLLSGLWLASVLWKVNTVVFAPVWLRLGRWRTVVVVGVVVAVTTLPYFLVFPAHAGDLLLNNFGSRVAGHELGNLGFRQLVFEALAALGAGPAVQQLAQWVVVGLVGGLSLWLTWRRPNTPVAAQLSLWLTAFFLASPQVWEHHYVMLLPVLIVAYRARPGWLLASLWLLLALPTPFGFIGLQPVIAANYDLRAFALEPVWQPLAQHAAKALPTLGLFAYWVKHLWGQKAAEPVV